MRQITKVLAKIGIGIFKIWNQIADIIMILLLFAFVVILVTNRNFDWTGLILMLFNQYTHQLVMFMSFLVVGIIIGHYSKLQD